MQLNGWPLKSRQSKRHPLIVSARSVPWCDPLSGSARSVPWRDRVVEALGALGAAAAAESSIKFVARMDYKDAKCVLTVVHTKMCMYKAYNHTRVRSEFFLHPISYYHCTKMYTLPLYDSRLGWGQRSMIYRSWREGAV